MAGLQSEIAALQEQLQEKENTIASLQAEREKDLQSFRAQLESKEQAIAHLTEQLKEAEGATLEVQTQLSCIASYFRFPDYKAAVLDTYLGNKYPESRVAALHLIALDKDLPQDQRRKIAAEMIQHKLRDVAPCKAFVDQIKKDLNLKSDEEVEPEYARWYRDRASDNPVILVEIASGLAEVPAARRDWGCRALRLFYGNINLDDPRLHDQWRRESFYKELRALKKRSLEEIEKRIKLQEEEQRRKPIGSI